MIDAGKLQVEIRNGLMLVKLPDNILFDPGKTDLKPQGKDAHRAGDADPVGIEGRKFQVTGHTDNIPIKSAKFKSNWELSTARAVEVTKLMIADGMDAEAPVGRRLRRRAAGRRQRHRRGTPRQPSHRDRRAAEHRGPAVDGRHRQARLVIRANLLRRSAAQHPLTLGRPPVR